MAVTETVAEPEVIEEEIVDETVVDDSLKFTQQQMSDVAAAEKAKATRAAQKKAKAELEAELGMSVSDAQKLVAQQAAVEEAQMTELEKVRRESDEAKREAAELRAEVLRERLDIKAERALVAAGVVISATARLVRLLDLSDDADDDAIVEAIEQLRAEMPQLFTETEPEEVAQLGRSGVSRSGSQPPKNPAPVTTGIDAGRQRFRNSSVASDAPTPLERLQGKTT